MNAAQFEKKPFNNSVFLLLMFTISVLLAVNGKCRLYVQKKSGFWFVFVTNKLFFQLQYCILLLSEPRTTFMYSFLFFKLARIMEKISVPMVAEADQSVISLKSLFHGPPYFVQK